MQAINNPYRCIGKGFCGSVWAAEDGTNHAIKREDGGPGRSVTNDYNMHLQIIRSANQHRPSMPLAIPQCQSLIYSNNMWWVENLHRFPAGFTECRAIVSERIPKIPRSISDKIVDLFCAGNTSLSAFVKANEDDDCCLIRPYLGRRREREATNTSRFHRFSLRNVPLHINQMEDFGLDYVAYAQTMADALAMMHWGAKVDANDVEFVLAPPRASSTRTSFPSHYLGEHVMWILDFDCVRHMSMDEAGLKQACAAFMRNDPFYPRPDGTETADGALWWFFRQRFLDTSAEILGDGCPHAGLPRRLMEMIEEEGCRRRKKKEELRERDEDTEQD